MPPEGQSAESTPAPSAAPATPAPAQPSTPSSPPVPSPPAPSSSADSAPAPRSPEPASSPQPPERPRVDVRQRMAEQASQSANEPTPSTPESGNSSTPPTPEATAPTPPQQVPNSPQPPATPQQGAPQPEQPQAPWYSQLEQMGFQGIESAEDAQRRLIEAYQMQREQLAQRDQRWHEVQPLVQRGYQAMHQTPPPQQPQSNDEGPQPWRPVPEIPENASRYITIDKETGQRTFVEGTPQDIRDAVESHDYARQNFVESLTTRPHEVFATGVADALQNESVSGALRQVVQGMFSEFNEANQRRQLASQVVQRNADMLYERNPYTGQPDPNRPTAYHDAIAQVTQMLGDAPLPPEIKFEMAQSFVQQRLAGMNPQQRAQQSQAMPQQQFQQPQAQQQFVPAQPQLPPAPQPQAPPPPQQPHPDQARMDFLRNNAAGTAGNRTPGAPYVPQQSPVGPITNASDPRERMAQIAAGK